MLYGMSPLRRALYFILPLVAALTLTGIVVIDAANTPGNAAAERLAELEASVPEGHSWLAFDLSNQTAGRTAEGTQIAVSLLEGESMTQEASADGQLLFDLGQEGEVESVTITWPDGRIQNYGSIGVDTEYELTYPATANVAIDQWFTMNGALASILGYLLLGFALIGLAVRVVTWAESQEAYGH